MKKIITLALAAVLAISMIGCTPKNTETEGTTAPETTVAPTTGAVVDPDFATILGELGMKLELPMLMDADAMMLTDSFGLNEGDLDLAIVKMPMMMVSATEFGVFKGDAAVITAAIEMRIAALETTWGQYLPDQFELVQNYSTYTNGDYVMYVICEEDNKQYIENAFERAFDPSIEELVKPASFRNVNGAEITAVSDNGFTVLVEGTYTIEATIAEGGYVDIDFTTNEVYVPAVGDLVDMAFDPAVVDNGDAVLKGSVTFLAPSAIDPNMGGGDVGIAPAAN